MTLSNPSDKDLLHHYEFVDKIHSTWESHQGQTAAIQRLFFYDTRSIFIQCGRKWGKTELAAYFLWRWAYTFPGAQCYYVAPLLNQAREIVWADPRLQNFGPREWLVEGTLGINNTEMRLRFKNGSFIKVDGSDNYDKHRGTRPHIIVYEEFKDHRKQFREIMRPNLSVYNAPEVFIGTPPEDDGDEANNEFLLTAQEHRLDPKKFFHHAPTRENPHISTDWLHKEKERLYLRGEGDIWEREYEAIYIKGGAHKIFPMINQSIITPHDVLMKEIERDKKKLEWFMWADPAGATCFAVLFVAINPYSKVVYVLDEIYETSQANMTVKIIGRSMLDKRDELCSYVDWRQGYDEAATWFANEMLETYEESLEPTHKARADKISGLSLIKDIILAGKVKMSDRCQKLYWEMDKYRKDGSGKIPKKDDHLIDCFRYILDAAYYEHKEEIEQIKEKDPMWRGARIQDDFAHITEDGFRNEFEDVE